jgi:uncharacterized protein YqkB
MTTFTKTQLKCLLAYASKDQFRANLMGVVVDNDGRAFATNGISAIWMLQEKLSFDDAMKAAQEWDLTEHAGIPRAKLETALKAASKDAPIAVYKTDRATFHVSTGDFAASVDVSTMGKMPNAGYIIGGIDKTLPAVTEVAFNPSLLAPLAASLEKLKGIYWRQPDNAEGVILCLAYVDGATFLYAQMSMRI